MATLRQVLSGSAILAAGSNVSNLTLSTPLLDLEKAFLLASYEPSADEPQDGEISYQITGLDQIRFQRNTGTGAPAINISWYVIEFTSGVRVQRGQIFPNAATVTLAIAAVDLTKTFIISSSRRSGSAFEGRDFVELDLPNSTTLQARIGTSSSITVEYQIVEYDNCTTQSGRIASWTGNSVTTTISTVDPAKSLLFFSYLSSGGTTANIGQKLVSGELTNATTLTFERGGTGSTISISWFLVEFSDAVTVQRGISAFGATDLTQNSILATIDPARTIAFLGGWNSAHGRSPYSGNDHPGIAAFTSALNANQLTLTRGFTASDTTGATATWQVVEFPSATGGTDLSGASAGNSTDSGDLKVQALLSGLSSGNSTTQGSVSLVESLSGTSAGGSSDTGELVAIVSLSGASSGSSTDSGDLSADAALELSGVSDGSSTDTGNLSAIATLDGTSAGTSTDTGELQITLTLSGVSAGGSTDTGAIALSGIDGLSGDSIGTSTDSGDLSQDLTLSGISVGNSTDSGQISIDLTLSGTSTGSSSDGANLSALENLSGVSAGLSAMQGAIALALSLAGISAGTSTDGGDLELDERILTLEGISAGTSFDTGDLTLIATLIGESAGGSIDSAALDVAVQNRRPPINRRMGTRQETRMGAGRSQRSFNAKGGL